MLPLIRLCGQLIKFNAQQLANTAWQGWQSGALTSSTRRWVNGVSSYYKCWQGGQRGMSQQHEQSFKALAMVAELRWDKWPSLQWVIRTLVTRHGPSREWINRMSSFSKRWQGWKNGAWTSSMRRVLPTWHGPSRQWVNRMRSFSKRWQEWHNGTWTSSLRRTSPSRHGPSQK